MEKSNFNSQEYRDNLAKNLKETRKENPQGAVEKLETEKQTKEYNEAKKYSLAQRGIEKESFGEKEVKLEKHIFESEARELIKMVETSDFYHRISVSYNFPEDTEDNYASWDEETYWCDKETKKWRMVDAQIWGMGFNVGGDEEITKEEIVKRLGKLEGDASVMLMPMGTHCGSLQFVFGWVHRAKKEDVEEAVMPQHD